MNIKRKFFALSLLTLFQVFIFLSYVSAAVPITSEETITDVTTRAFSVIWKSNIPATADLKVYNSPACTVPTVGVTVTPHPVIGGVASAGIKATAEARGVMKVQVTGLSSNTEYCFQAETISKDTPADVALGAVRKVITMIKTIRTYLEVATGIIKPFSNDLLVFPVYDPDETPSNGSLLVAEGPGGAKVSAFVGDGVAPPNALIDMNNLFGATGINLDLLGGEVVALREFRGDNGLSTSATLTRMRKVQPDNDLAEVTLPFTCVFADNNCDDKVDVFDVQRALNIFGSVAGSNIFNSDFDYSGDTTVLGRIDVFDLQKFFNDWNLVIVP